MDVFHTSISVNASVMSSTATSKMDLPRLPKWTEKASVED